MLVRRQTVIRWILCLVLMGLAGISTGFTQDQIRVQIGRIDVTKFPDVTFTLAAMDGESIPVVDLSDLTISESGTAVTDFQRDSIPVGVEVVFVIDANRTINQRDDDNVTRKDEVRDSIVRFAGQFMNQAQLDRVSIVVPDGDNGRFLGAGAMTFPNEVINAINFYDAGTLSDTPLQEMMTMALEQTAENAGDGRFQAILLFTDGASIHRQLDFDTLVEQAQESNTVMYAAILGLRDDPDEIANVKRLYEPTHGFYVHMPGPNDTDPIYEAWQTHGVRSAITFRSTLGDSGQRILNVTLAGVSVSESFEVNVEPPSVRLVLDNSQPIRRVAGEPDTPLADMEPAIQPVVAQITWPDDHPRAITTTALSVNGVIQPEVSGRELETDGLWQFDWDISNLDAAAYNLIVQMTDELGLQVQSAPMTLNIEVERPEVVEVVEIEQVATIPVPEAGETATGNLAQRLGIVTIIIGVLAIGFAFLMMILAIFMMRRRQPAPVTPAPVAAVSLPPAAQLDHEATQIMMPAFVAAHSAGAYLEVLENAPEHKESIPLAESNLAIGRDASLAQVVFNDKSVSRLHARIMENNGAYRLYDEGSASGTYRNFERVGLTPQPLHDNDDIHIGRVHLRFRTAATAATADADSTQIMQAPVRPGTGRPTTRPATVDDDTSTQPFLPHQPASPGRSQPQRPSDDDPDDVSTQPFLPHSPKR